jgi:hypothetical protein
LINLTSLERLAAALPSHGELPYQERRRIRQKIAAQSPESLTQLEVMCAQHSLPVWQARFPDNLCPRKLLDEASHQPQKSSLVSEWQLLKTNLDDLFEMGDEFFPAIYAGFAYWAAARDLIGCQPAEPDVSSELEIDPELWSPCFFASLAVAGGAVWESVGQATQRRDYWEWYLLAAIPSCLSPSSST